MPLPALDETAPGPAPVMQGWDALFERLQARLAGLATHIRDSIGDRLPSYRTVDPQTLEHDIAFQLEQVLRSAHRRRGAVNERAIAELTVIGEARAQQGVLVDDMLRAWRIGIGQVVDEARRVSRRLGITDATVLEFIQSMLTWCDVAMVTTARAHRKAELAFGFAEEEQRAKFVHGTLLGAVPPTELGIQAEAYGLDPAGEYVAVRALLGEGDPRRRLEWALGFHDAARHGLCAVVDGCIIGFLNAPPPPDIDAVAGVGPPKPLAYLTESYRLATRALTTVQACGLRGAYDIPWFGVRAAVATDPDVGEALRNRYLAPLAEGGSPRELIATLRAFLACGLHVERAATRLFVHQNTVRYRLARFEELTGASLRDAEVLFGIWWALESERCVCSTPQGVLSDLGTGSLRIRSDPEDA